MVVGLDGFLVPILVCLAEGFPNKDDVMLQDWCGLIKDSGMDVTVGCVMFEVVKDLDDIVGNPVSIELEVGPI